MQNRSTYPIESDGRITHVTMHHSEHSIRVGDAYTVIVHDVLQTAEFTDVTFTTPTGYRCMFTYAIDTGLAAGVEVFYDSVLTGGVLSEPRNRNEESTNTSGIELRTGGTVTTIGSTAAAWSWGAAGSAPFDPALGGGASDSGILFPQNSVHRFRLTSSADDNRCTMRFNFEMEEMIPEEL